MKPVLKLSEKYLLALMGSSAKLTSDEQILSAFANVTDEEEEELPDDIQAMSDAIDGVVRMT